MKISSLRFGKYVLAVSGGVDSVVLLHVLSQQTGLELVIAHFDHGIRSDSHLDRQLVATLSQKYGLPFEFAEGKLGAGVSEAEAREARHKFLQHIRKKHNARATITAHHQDDALETMAFNVLRGTKRRGMSALQSTDDIIRPLMAYSKADILEYARKNNLRWREDSTNRDEKYTRNWIRRQVLPKLSPRQKRELVTTYTNARTRNTVLDDAVRQQLDDVRTKEGLNRRKFIALPYAVACEVMAEWLRQEKTASFDRKFIETMVVAAKTLPPGRRISLGRGGFLSIELKHLKLG